MGIQKANVLWRISIMLSALIVVAAPTGVSAATAADAPFALQVTPSPLVTSVRPGESKTLELRLRNEGSSEERLRVGLQGFRMGAKEKIELIPDAPKDITGWVSFKEPEFNVKGGEWFTEHIVLNVPKEAGFSYSFAIVISRAKQASPTPGTQALRGSVAVFTLVNVDRPGATRAFIIDRFESAKRLYEYLPAEFSVTIKNAGNTIVQPQGNIFIQRSSTGKPIAVLPLNDAGSYLLPGVTRTMATKWSDGFPVYVTQKDADNVSPSTNLVWDWGQAQHFRFGKYVAKIVAVYNDGQRDVPVVSEVSFWVVPWKLMLVGLLLFIVLIVGIVAIIRKVFKLGRYARKIHHIS